MFLHWTKELLSALGHISSNQNLAVM